MLSSLSSSTSLGGGVRVGLVIPPSEIKALLHFMIRCPISFDQLHFVRHTITLMERFVSFIPLVLGTAGSGLFIKISLQRSFTIMF